MFAFPYVQCGSHGYWVLVCNWRYLYYSVIFPKSLLVELFLPAAAVVILCFFNIHIYLNWERWNPVFSHSPKTIFIMGKAKKTKRFAMQRFAQMKKMIKPTDKRIKESEREKSKKKKPADPYKIDTHEVPQVSSALFFQYNTQLGPPYHILVDTNFINNSIRYKLDVIQNMMDCLYAKCIPYITDCVLGELEKLGQKFNVALKIIKDPRFERIHCMHKGTYADDCLVQRVTQHKCYIVATCDRDLKRRIRKIPGVPIMYVAHHRYTIERMPDAYGAPKI